MKKPTLFLGGSCDYKNYFNWRKAYLEKVTNIDFFDPYVEDWNDEARKNEEFHRENDDILLFTISGSNLFSIVELTDCSNKRPETTLAVFDMEAIEESGERMKSINAIIDLLKTNGVKVFVTHEDCQNYLKTI